MASLAKVEAQRISERTKAGLARARAHGKKLGRPALPDGKRAKIERLHRADPKRSIRSIAKAAGVAYETARAHIRSMSPNPQLPDLSTAAPRDEAIDAVADTKKVIPSPYGRQRPCRQRVNSGFVPR